MNETDRALVLLLDDMAKMLAEHHAALVGLAEEVKALTHRVSVLEFAQGYDPEAAATDGDG